ncbi:hypothetical protein SAMN06265348_10961 [Pedobacter westerhofensis]|uniref:Uncharacterized protein n=1 Tax=Pedobacter westerhofensis TaxID=425512 RepID=A0A521ES89_9SPHI|nr:hypothetical protein SAMN06265348_10961 [Pedobacter westerhofensis]
MLIVYISFFPAMKSIKVFLLPGLIIKKLGLTKIYYWFNR